MGHVHSTVNLGDIKYVPPVTPCRQCGRSLRSDTDAPYEGLGQDKSPKFLFSDAPCCESASESLLEVAGCGIADPDINRVVGGTAATSADNIPWQCMIMKSDTTSNDIDNLAFSGCAATLISCNPGILVTAAQCFQSSGVAATIFKIPTIDTTKLATYPRVSCGRLHLTTTAETTAGANDATNQQKQTQFINKNDFIKIHPDFNPITGENDIALIRVLGNFDCGTDTTPKSNVFPACLPKAEKFGDFSNWVTTIVSGWGTSESALISPVLNFAKVEPLNDANNNKACTDELVAAGVTPVPDLTNSVCVKPLPGTTFGTDAGGACLNDQGGPLVTKTSGDTGFTLVGVISQPTCGLGVIPSVHTKIKPNLDWITTEAKKLIALS